MEINTKPGMRKLSTIEWMLIGMLIIGVVLVALRWDYISHEVSQSVRSYFEKTQ